MRDLAVLFLHLLATVARLAGPGGARSVVAESVLVKQQLLILNRSRKRCPNLRLSACAWRIAKFLNISCEVAILLGSLVRDLAVLFLPLLTTAARLAGPGGAHSVVAESLLVKQQRLILNRSRKRSPRLRVSDRIIPGVCALSCDHGGYSVPRSS